MEPLFIINRFTDELRHETRNGREYLVAPVTMIVSGVLKGSRGALYYPPDEVTKNYSAWNDIPIVVYHPTFNNSPVSGRDPKVLDKQKIGRVYNARIKDGNTLVGEAWLDKERTKAVDPRILNMLIAKEPVGISTGLFTDNYEVPLGTLSPKGVAYNYTARNYQPDHLAILPDKVGACSIADGCGMGLLHNESTQEGVFNGWITTEEGQHIFIGDDGEVHPHGPHGPGVGKLNSAKVNFSHESRNKPGDERGGAGASDKSTAASGSVAGQTRGPTSESSSQRGPVASKPAGDATAGSVSSKGPVAATPKPVAKPGEENAKSPKTKQITPAAKEAVPVSLDDANKKIDRYEKFFREKGNHQVADLMGKLRDHVNAVGTEQALKDLGHPDPNKVKGGPPAPGKSVQYWGVGTEEANWKNMGHFMEAYLARNGITAVTGEHSDPNKPMVSALAKPDKYVTGDFKPTNDAFKNKLEESKALPGLQKSEDINKLLGKDVTHLTPEVTAKLDEHYGKGEWIVKAYGDDAAAGFGIYFPQRANALSQDAKSTIWAAGEQVAKHGFELNRDKGTDRVIGLKHKGGDTYDFGTPRYHDIIQGDVRHWADKAAAVAGNEKGAELPNGGKEFMVQPAFKAVGISDAERAAGKTWHESNEGRVHLVTRPDGNVEVIPYATWLKGGNLPVVFGNDDTRAMEKAAQDAVNQLPKAARKGQVYAPDVMKTADGYKVVELNAQGDHNGSGYLHDNHFTIDSYVSHLTGREPAHASFIRTLLTKKGTGTRLPTGNELMSFDELLFNLFNSNERNYLVPQSTLNEFIINELPDITPEKACQILKDGEVHGHPLTDAQKGLFGAVCGQRDKIAHNVFCPTGDGGGQDNSCGPDGGSRSTPSSSKLSEDSLFSLGRLAGSLVKGSTIDKSTIAGRIDPSEKTVDALKHLNELLSTQGLEVVPNTGSSIVRSSRGGAKTGKTTGWVVRKKSTTDNARDTSNVHNTTTTNSLSNLDPEEACQVLEDGELNGRPLTDSQIEQLEYLCEGANNESPDLDNIADVFSTIEVINMVTKTEDGTELSASDFAYVADPEEPSTWKLRIDDAQHVGGALAALGKGFRGNKVSIPPEDLPAVKKKVRAAWLKFNPDKSESDVPSVIANVSMDSVATVFNSLFVTNQGELSMTPEERQKIISGLTANCSCQETKAKMIASLNAASDSNLMTMDECKKMWGEPDADDMGGGMGATKNKKKPTGNQVVLKEFTDTLGNKHVWNSSMQAYETTPKPITDIPTNPLMLNQNTKPYANMEDFLSKAGTPVENEIWQSAKEVHTQTKQVLVEQLTANFQGEAKEHLIKVYDAMKIPDLRVLVAGLVQPQPNQTTYHRPVTNYAAAAGTYPSQQVINEEPLLSPVYDYSKAGK